MIRLRTLIDRGIRHPFLGPLLLLFLALVLAFVALHTLEDGVAGSLFACMILGAAALRLVVVLGRRWRLKRDQAPLLGRAPPKWSLSPLAPRGVAPVPVAAPLRL